MTDEAPGDSDQLPAQSADGPRPPVRPQEQQLLGLGQVIRQDAYREPQAVGREVSTRHLFHPEPDFEFLDEVFDLTPAVVEPNDLLGREGVPIRGNDVIAIAVRPKERKLGILPALDDQPDGDFGPRDKMNR